MKVTLKNRHKYDNIGNVRGGVLLEFLESVGNYLKGDIAIKSIGGKLINLKDGNGWEFLGVSEKGTKVRVLSPDEEVILSNN